MRRVFKVLITAVLVSVAVAAPTSQAAADDENARHYYLALGDSVATGFQLWPPDPYYSPSGYVARVHATLAEKDRKLKLRNISCNGESTASMLFNSPNSGVDPCGSSKSQLQEAKRILRAHKAKVDLITIDIGGNDVLPCFASMQPACFQQGLDQIMVNLDRILAELQRTAPSVRIVGMTYYNPFACLLSFDPDFAAASQQIVLDVNAVLLGVYAAHQVEVADVAGAFAVADLAASAQAAAAWTWFCDPDHSGNVHPNDAGHQIIADAFLDILAP